MKLQILSDLHLSRAPCEVPATGADLVLLAGDIHRPESAIAWAKKLKIPAVYVPGDHEYYGSSLSDTDQQLLELSRASNVTVLNCQELRLAGVRILGATLWTDFRLASNEAERKRAMDMAGQYSHDFSRIYRDESRATFTLEDCARCFAEHLAWLESALAERFDGHTVVMTHFAPSPGSIARKFVDSPLNPFFVSELDDLIRRVDVSLWVHGHTHTSFDYQIGDTRILCNPRGYIIDGRLENPQFDPYLTVELR